MSSQAYRDGVMCGLGLAIGCVHDELERTTDVDGRELLRTLMGTIAASGAQWSKQDRLANPVPLSEEVTPS